MPIQPINIHNKTCLVLLEYKNNLLIFFNKGFKNKIKRCLKAITNPGLHLPTQRLFLKMYVQTNEENGRQHAIQSPQEGLKKTKKPERRTGLRAALFKCTAQR